MPGFNVLPGQIDMWKRRLVIECDPVRTWLADHLRDCAPDSSITTDEIHQALQRHNLSVRKPLLQAKLDADFPMRGAKYGLAQTAVRYAGMCIE